MELFRAVPDRPYLRLPAAIAAGAVLGSVLFAVVDVVAFGAHATFPGVLVEVAFVSIVSLLAGGVAWLTYALPLLMFLVPLRLAGPGSALLVALAPGAFASLGSISIGIVLAIYGLSAGAVFVATAYRQPHATQRTRSEGFPRDFAN